MIAIRSMDEVGQDAWDRFVDASHVYGAIYSRYGWLKSLEEGSAGTPFNIAAWSDGALVGIFPNFLQERGPFVRRLVSVPFGWGGPIVTRRPGDVLDALFGEVSMIISRTRSRLHQFSFLDFGGVQYHSYFQRRGYVLGADTCRLVIDLTKPEAELEASMTHGERHELKKVRADPAVAVVEAETTHTTLATFHRMYEDTMRRVNGTAIPPTFFASLGRHLPTKDVRIFFAVVNGTEVSARLHLVDHISSAAFWQFGATYQEHLRRGTNVLLHAHCVRWAKATGLRYYDMGATPASFDHGLFAFKRRLGGSVVPVLEWGRYANPTFYRAARAFSTALRRIRRRRTPD